MSDKSLELSFDREMCPDFRENREEEILKEELRRIPVHLQEENACNHTETSSNMEIDDPVLQKTQEFYDDPDSFYENQEAELSRDQGHQSDAE